MYMYLHVHICMFVYVYTYVCMYVCIYIYIYIDNPLVALIICRLCPSRSTLSMSLRIASKFRFRSDRFACDLGPFWVNVGCILGPFWGCQVGSNANLRRIGPQVASKAVPIRFLAGPCAKVIWIAERIACSAPRGNHRKSPQTTANHTEITAGQLQTLPICQSIWLVLLYLLTIHRSP